MGLVSFDSKISTIYPATKLSKSCIFYFENSCLKLLNGTFQCSRISKISDSRIGIFCKIAKLSSGGNAREVSGVLGLGYRLSNASV